MQCFIFCSGHWYNYLFCVFKQYGLIRSKVKSSDRCFKIFLNLFFRQVKSSIDKQLLKNEIVRRLKCDASVTRSRWVTTAAASRWPSGSGLSCRGRSSTRARSDIYNCKICFLQFLLSLQPVFWAPRHSA
jgi:hypothetical protein